MSKNNIMRARNESISNVLGQLALKSDKVSKNKKFLRTIEGTNINLYERHQVQS